MDSEKNVYVVDFDMPIRTPKKGGKSLRVAVRSATKTTVVLWDAKALAQNISYICSGVLSDNASADKGWQAEKFVDAEGNALRLFAESGKNRGGYAASWSKTLRVQR